MEVYDMRRFVLESMARTADLIDLCIILDEEYGIDPDKIMVEFSYNSVLTEDEYKEWVSRRAKAHSSYITPESYPNSRVRMALSSWTINSMMKQCQMFFESVSISQYQEVGDEKEYTTIEHKRLTMKEVISSEEFRSNLCGMVLLMYDQLENAKSWLSPSYESVQNIYVEDFASKLGIDISDPDKRASLTKSLSGVIYIAHKRTNYYRELKEHLTNS